MVTEVHRAARAAWEALRESSMVTNGPAGTHGGVAHYQLSEDEFRAIHPAPNLRDTLRGLRR